MNERSPIGRAFERRIGRLLIVATYVAVAFLVVGVALMIANGISPLDGGPALDIGTIPGEIGRLGPTAFLWLGIVTVIATPISRVLAAAVGFGRADDRPMTAIAIGILVVILVGVVAALAGGG
jgi:uncharacterized membrane protein